MQKQNPRNLPNTKKTTTKSEKVVEFVHNKNKNNKDNNKTHKKKLDISNNKKNTTTKIDSVTETWVSDVDTCTEIEDNVSMGWRSLSEISLTSENSDTCDTDVTG